MAVDSKTDDSGAVRHFLNCLSVGQWEMGRATLRNMRKEAARCLLSSIAADPTCVHR